MDKFLKEAAIIYSTGEERMFSPDYQFNTMFREILTLNKDSNIVTLVQEDLPQPKPVKAVTTYSNLLSLFAVNVPEETPNLQKILTKLFRTKIEKWSNILDSKLEEVRYQPKHLKALQKVVNKIFLESKIVILEEKLQESGLSDEKTKRLLLRLNDMVCRTLATPSIEKWRIRSKKNAFVIVKKEEGATTESMQTPRRYLQGLLIPELPKWRGRDEEVEEKSEEKKKNIKRNKSDSELWESSENCPNRNNQEEQTVTPNEIFELIANQRQSLHHQQRACEISIYSQAWGRGWKEKLIQAFDELQEEAAVCAVAEKLDMRQVYQILNRFLDDEKNEWKLIYLLGAIRHRTFVEVLQSLEDDMLIHLNEILKKSSSESIKWFQQNFTIHRDGFIGSCNRMKNKIDNLAKKLRDDLDGHTLTENDLLKIHEIEDFINLTMNLIIEKLQPFLQGVITHPETRHVLFVGIKKEYKTLLTRVKETKYYEERPAGCLWPIIYRNIFERTELEDDDLAYDIFADWGIFLAIDYRKVGLFGQITDEQYKKIASDTLSPNIFQIAINNLDKLGITNIRSWKEKKIFNRHMLKNFLSKNENVEQLTLWTKASRPNL